MKPSILLTSLGIGKTPNAREYKLNGSTVQARFSALALWQLLPESERPGRVVGLITDAARRAQWSAFESDAKRLGLEVGLQLIDEATPTVELARLLTGVATHVPKKSRVVFDLTQGLKHHAFHFYSLLLYLSSLREVEIDGIWYSMFPSGGKPSSIIDMRPALELAEWVHAVRVFRDQGATAPLADQVAKLYAELDASIRSQDAEEQDFQVLGPVRNLEKGLRGFSFTYESVLPLELGFAAQSLVKELDQGIPEIIESRLPAAKELAEAIRDEATSYLFPTSIVTKRGGKSRVKLNDKELRRQHRLIDKYIDRQQVSLAIGLLREWMVSWMVPAVSDSDNWLIRSHRLRAEAALNAAAKLLRRKDGIQYLDEDERSVARLWDNVSQFRNEFLHQGMTSEDVKDIGETLETIRDKWPKLYEYSRPSLSGVEKLLISPLGQSPGVLFNALREVQPTRCIVICSKETEAGIQPAIDQAGYSGPVIPLIMTDPYSGAREINGLIDRAFYELIRANEVVANLTGGTTLMSVVVQRLIREALKFGKESKELVLIDKRSWEEKIEDPWFTSEVYWLGDEEEGK